MSNSVTSPYQVVKDFEAALCQYTGAKYAVTTTSCTAALMLAMEWSITEHKRTEFGRNVDVACHLNGGVYRPFVDIPNRTYVSVPMSIIRAGGRPTFSDKEWLGEYQLGNSPVWDCARWFRRDMYIVGRMQCLSFHWSKQLAIGQGGCILHDNDAADEWLRRMRFDGRKEGVAPKDDTFTLIGHHCYMSPRDAAEGLSRLAVFKDTGQPLPNDNYPDLSKFKIFGGGA